MKNLGFFSRTRKGLCIYLFIYLFSGSLLGRTGISPGISELFNFFVKKGCSKHAHCLPGCALLCALEEDVARDSRCAEPPWEPRKNSCCQESRGPSTQAVVLRKDYMHPREVRGPLLPLSQSSLLSSPRTSRQRRVSLFLVNKLLTRTGALFGSVR